MRGQLDIQRFWRRRPWLALVAIAYLAACGSPKEEVIEDDSSDPDPIPNVAPVIPPSNLNCPLGTSLTYSNFGEAFMLNYCTSCHSSALTEAQRAGAPIGSDFDSPVKVQIYRTLILERTVGETPTMPPTANIPAYELAQLTNWLECGAPSGDQKITTGE